jgi:hypothetical protein
MGPARFWNKLSYRLSRVDPTDVFSISVIGVSAEKQEQVLYTGNDNPVDLTFIDPLTYPFIKIEITSTDDVDLTPVHLENWFVEYTPSAEGILLYRGTIEPVSLFEGQTWNGKFSYINLTKHDFILAPLGDSLTNDLKVTNQQTGIIKSDGFNRKSPLPFDSIVYNLNLKTIGKAGTNDVQLLVNDQLVPEQYRFNNTIFLENYLTVVADKQPPVLDVTVDDRYLINGDYVSPTPKFQIQIIDENNFYLKSDTIGIEINITNQETKVIKRVHFSDPALTWNPATLDSDFNISFTTFLTVGQYELTVQAVDASGNKSGATPYTVTFNVTDDSKIQLGIPFPNPSHSTFSFPVKISGNELPESFQLKIYGPDGRLMKQFNLGDVSGFYIGTNYIKWDTSEFNDGLLPTGLYYYSIDIELAGNNYSKSGRILLIRP